MKPEIVEENLYIINQGKNNQFILRPPPTERYFYERKQKFHPKQLLRFRLLKLIQQIIHPHRKLFNTQGPQ